MVKAGEPRGAAGQAMEEKTEARLKELFEKMPYPAQIVIAAGKASEAALTIFEDLINPYWKKQT